MQTVKGPDRSRALPDKEIAMLRIALLLILVSMMLVLAAPAY
ncbi:hypothetical protein W822_18750 [Advenella kashmirensis W13003]|uniref:Uncharacterized protein n=1 Tax=Advenella kashmirensis W13003 TaxID=1424334 RepID=V8QQ24_9BURK|nr:hypothetical protein W822_18750 [Advenella kashmirensis W13003]